MELTTRCPNCETVFPATLEQLQLRKGYIRCINCAHIFDGFDAVVPSSAASQARGEKPSPQLEPTIPSVSAPIMHTDADRVRPAPYVPLPQAEIPYPDEAGNAVPLRNSREHHTARSREPEIPDVVRGRSALPVGGVDFTISDVPARNPVGSHTIGEGVGIAPARASRDDAPRVREEPVAEEVALIVEPRKRGHPRGQGQAQYLGVHPGFGAALTPLWAILSVLALALLVAQGVYVYRAQLANNFPQLRPVLESACDRIGCEVPYERHADAIVITGSALRVSAAPQDDGVSSLTLDITLRNTYTRPQEWPALVLEIKDASGAVVVRRNLPPAVWVPPQLRDGPFAPESALTVQVPVTVRGVQVNGYQLDKYFP